MADVLPTTGRRRLLKSLDSASGIVALVTLGLWLLRVAVNGTAAFDSRAQLTAVTATLAALVGVFLGLVVRQAAPRAITILRPVVYVAAVGLSASLWSRLLAGPLLKPPLVVPTSISFDGMSDSDRAHWALRMALHAAIAAPGQRHGPISVPAEWPFPPDAVLAVSDSSGTKTVVARAGQATCVAPIDFTPASWAAFRDGPRCGINEPAQNRLAFYKPVRAPLRTPGKPLDSVGDSWTQYRHDAQATAASPNSQARGAAWISDLLGGARASASIVGSQVLIGTHGTGSLESFDVVSGRLRWRVLLPNWVHQDAVSDGRYVAVGFGDGAGAFHAQAPGGVAVFSASSGQLQWTQFTAGSQMTSPVLLDGAVVYVNWTGLLEMRSIDSGELRWSTRLPGHIAMGPPLLRGDTMIVTLDDANVCTVALRQRRVAWCASVPGLDFFGVSSAAVVGDTILLSARVPPTIANLLRNLPRLTASQALKWIAGFLTPNGHLAFEAQRLLAVRLADGRLLWRTPDYYVERPVKGHISGKPVWDSSVIAVTLPLPNVLVVLERRTLKQLWVAGGIEARGPVLLRDGRIYYATGDGELRVHRSTDGALLCAVRVPRTFDRTGPATGFGSFYFASLEGDLASVPKRLLDTCQADSLRAMFTAHAPARPAALPMRMPQP